MSELVHHPMLKVKLMDRYDLFQILKMLQISGVEPDIQLFSQIAYVRKGLEGQPRHWGSLTPS